MLYLRKHFLAFDVTVAHNVPKSYLPADSVRQCLS